MIDHLINTIVGLCILTITASFFTFMYQAFTTIFN